jgi:hypothetical protein
MGACTNGGRLLHFLKTVPRKGTKREYGSADVSANAVAAPATVCGEPTSFVPPGNREGGRWAQTHKPGDLPSNVTHPPGGVALVVRTSAVTLFGPAVELSLWVTRKSVRTAI